MRDALRGQDRHGLLEHQQAPEVVGALRLAEHDMGARDGARLSAVHDEEIGVPDGVTGVGDGRARSADLVGVREGREGEQDGGDGDPSLHGFLQDREYTSDWTDGRRDPTPTMRRLSRVLARHAWLECMAALDDPARHFGPRWRDRPVEGEEMWAILLPRFAGVGSLVPVEPGILAYRVCLQPAARSRGLRLHVREWLVAEAFRRPEITTLRSRVLLSNPHVQRWQAAPPRGWTYRGVMGDPPYAYWELARAL